MGWNEMVALRWRFVRLMLQHSKHRDSLELAVKFSATYNRCDDDDDFVYDRPELRSNKVKLLFCCRDSTELSSRLHRGALLPFFLPLLLHCPHRRRWPADCIITRFLTDSQEMSNRTRWIYFKWCDMMRSSLFIIISLLFSSRFAAPWSSALWSMLNERCYGTCALVGQLGWVLGWTAKGLPAISPFVHDRVSRSNCHGFLSVIIVCVCGRLDAKGVHLPTVSCSVHSSDDARTILGDCFV